MFKDYYFILFLSKKKKERKGNEEYSIFANKYDPRFKAFFKGDDLKKEMMVIDSPDGSIEVTIAYDDVNTSYIHEAEDNSVFLLDNTECPDANTTITPPVTSSNMCSHKLLKPVFPCAVSFAFNSSSLTAVGKVMMKGSKLAYIYMEGDQVDYRREEAPTVHVKDIIRADRLPWPMFEDFFSEGEEECSRELSADSPLASFFPHFEYDIKRDTPCPVEGEEGCIAYCESNPPKRDSDFDCIIVDSQGRYLQVGNEVYIRYMDEVPTVDDFKVDCNGTKLDAPVDVCKEPSSSGSSSSLSSSQSSPSSASTQSSSSKPVVDPSSASFSVPSLLVIAAAVVLLF